MLVTNLLERKRELEGKETQYSPQGGDEGEYLAELREKYTWTQYYHTASHRYFNDKSLQGYMNRCSDDSFLYVAPTSRDNWHSKTRRQTPREKMNALLAAILDQDLQGEAFALDDRGREARSGAQAAEDLIRFSDAVEGAQEKRKMRALELLKYGTCAVEVSWLDRKKTEKKLHGKFDPAELPPTWDAKEVSDFMGIWTKIIPLNRVMLGDITKYFISEQPHIWKEYVMTYDEAYAMFHGWRNWKYVKPVGDAYDSWNDTLIQTDTEENTSTDRHFVRMKVYENKWSDEYAILLNNVLMTPVGFPMPTPDKEYSLTWTQLEMYDQDFAYGRSFFAAVHNDGVTLDFLYNAIVDKARQGLEPPLITSFRNIVSKNMFAPGKITHGDISFKRAVDHVGVTNADIEITRFVEENLNKTSVSPMVSGQAPAGDQTAFAIREQQKAALRMIGLVLYSIARMECDIAEKKLAYALKHYPTMRMPRLDRKTQQVSSVGRTFSVRGEDGVRQETTFSELPEAPKAIMAMRESMLKEETEAAAKGDRLKRRVVDPEWLRRLKYRFHIVANPSQRKSKMADVAEVRETYAIYAANPLIDPEWNTRRLLRAMNDEEEEAIRKQVPQGDTAGQGGGMERKAPPPQGGGGGPGTKGAIAPTSVGTNPRAVGGMRNEKQNITPNMRQQRAFDKAPGLV